MSTASSVGSSVGSAVASSVARTAGGFDSDALAYFAAVEAAGGSFDLTGVNAAYTSSYVKQAHSDLFAGLKTDSLWSKITELYLLSGKTYAGMAIKAKGTGTLTLTNFVSGDYVSAGSGAGLKGNGSTKYIDTGVLCNAFSASSRGLAYYETERTTSTFDVGIGGGPGYTNMWQLGSENPSTQQGYRCSNGSSGPFITGATAGWWSGSSVSAAEGTLYKNGVSQSVQGVGAATPAANPIFMFAYGNNASPTEHTSSRLSVGMIKLGTTAQDEANLSTRVNAFMTSLGANVY